MLHKRLIIDGVEFPLAVPQSGCGKPDEKTQGCKGLTYLDEDTGKLYKCLSDEPGACRWEPANNDLEERTAKLEQQIADMNYKKIEISSFTAKGGIRERGITVTDVTLEWATNKEPTTLTLDGESVPAADKSKTVSGLSITWDKGKTWKLVATDERDGKAEKTTSVTFQNGIYWGTAAKPTTVSDAFVRGLKTKELTGTKNRTVNVAGGDGLYFWYAYPKRLGTSLFNIGGFDYEYELTTIALKNQHGYTEDYYVYRSGQYVPASLSVTVKNGG